MFKNIQFFRIGTGWEGAHATIEEALAKASFVDCGANQERSIGWVPPRGEAHGALAESVAGQIIVKLMVESKVLPGGAVKDAVVKRMKAIEDENGRKPWEKEKKEIAEDVRLSMLAQAFTTKATTLVWINPTERLLVVEASSQARSDLVVTELVKVLEGISFTPISTQQSPASCMSVWLDTQELPVDFTADRDCVLKAADESKATVRYAKHALDIEEIRAHIAAGKSPTQLAMTWRDRLSFVLTDQGSVKKLAFLESVFEGGEAAGKDDSFDADVAIATGELIKFIPDLLKAQGGEVAAA